MYRISQGGHQRNCDSLPEVKIIEPKSFNDARGYFFESFNAREFAVQVAGAVFYVALDLRLDFLV
ncbi:dTDP-4-dehydrorhamnose 3,5-epimerase [Mycoavidus cysteinexigens]|uniref:dTDP-4-dehydrorhamnose 3,5-epimerase n=1 Tax=Mycoavidus cysteinexigens TaxID=1553431 RepID=A0A2Z6ETG9_9BURK|nr:dTDP-4-dehydrorhamnose 3,5-epimerase [Mycoavidus cysteinexigens]GAM52592.1 hypothetical protein EBME_1055 [bacterium endosymbiont of Mortierella elongata FMR23-6]GLR01442.1 hypothetical protein GCM10007934_12540 [Mycoavidus cysteinexigens]